MTDRGSIRNLCSPSLLGCKNLISDHGGHSLVHRLLELLLVEELQDEEHQLPAQRRHGCPDPSRSLQLSRPNKPPAFPADPLPNPTKPPATAWQTHTDTTGELKTLSL
jgi:hypothetical protein